MFLHHPDPFDELVQVAVILKRIVPDPNFSGQTAMVCAGIKKHEQANSSDLIDRFRHAARSQQRQNGPPTYSLDTTAMMQRYTFFQFYAKFCPATNKGLALVNIHNRIVD